MPNPQICQQCRQSWKNTKKCHMHLVSHFQCKQLTNSSKLCGIYYVYQMNSITTLCFYTQCCFNSSIGQLWCDGGWRDIIVDTGVYASATVDQMLTGKLYKRAVRGLILMYEALMRCDMGHFSSGMRKTITWMAFRHSFGSIWLINSLIFVMEMTYRTPHLT